MMKRRHTVGVCALIACMLDISAAKEAESIVVEGAVQQVTLYREQALVTRLLAIPPGRGLRTVDVLRLPEMVLPGSLFAEGDATTAVRAVRVKAQPELEVQPEEVRKLETETAALIKQRDEAQQDLAVAEENLKSLEQLVRFSSESVQSDLARGAVNAAAVTELATYLMTQRRELSKERHQRKLQIDELEQQLQAVAARKSQLTSGGGRLAHQAQVIVETKDGAAGTVRLNYLVGGCGWAPQYTIRGKAAAAEFQFRYSAVVEQMSGEDWNNVQLTLSTASPTVNAARPQLTPFRVSIASAAETPNADPFAPGDSGADSPGEGPQQELTRRIHQLRQQQRFAESSLEAGGGPGDSSSDSTARDLQLNTLAGQMQHIEMLAAATSWRPMTHDVDADIASQVYALSEPVSLGTRRQSQLVTIIDTTFLGEMHYVATPLLSTYAYREAQMKNSHPLGLLSGPAAVYLDDRFVGRTQLPSTASGQTLTIGFGADQQVRTRRELLNKQDEVQGGNRRLRFDYRLVLANFKDQPVTVRLLDRIPVTRQTQQLDVRIDEMQIPLSEDPLYLRLERPTGVLRWDVTVPANRHGSEAFDVPYSFVAEFDRSQVLTTARMREEMQADFREMMLPSEASEFGASPDAPAAP